MSLVKNIAIGVGSTLVIAGLGYLGYKKIRGKKEKVSNIDKEMIRNEFTSEDLKKIIKDEEELIQNLKNLHYKESFIKELEDSLKMKKDLLNTAF